MSTGVTDLNLRSPGVVPSVLQEHLEQRFPIGRATPDEVDAFLQVYRDDHRPTPVLVGVIVSDRVIFCRVRENPGCFSYFTGTMFFLWIIQFHFDSPLLEPSAYTDPSDKDSLRLTGDMKVHFQPAVLTAIEVEHSSIGL
jgi:hypothetical protein